jgi:cell division protein FtsL
MSYSTVKKNKRTPVSRTNKSTNLILVLNVVAIVMSVSLFTGYLVVNNSSTAGGFEVRNLERQIAELQDQSDRLDLELVSMQAMSNIEKQINELGFVPITGLEYISGAPAVVAVK